MAELITLAKVYADYAKAIGCKSLTARERQQAYLNAILEGKQVELHLTKGSDDRMAEQPDAE